MSAPIYLFSRVASTNELALKQANSAEHGSTWVADSQSEGRGRREPSGQRRTWFSPAGCNLYLSVLIREGLRPETAPTLTLAAGLAVCEVLSDHTGVDVWLKWPNDVWVGTRKLGGVLTEARSSGSTVDAVVVGVGLNINVGEHEFPTDIAEQATSVLRETGAVIDRMGLIVPLRDAILSRCREASEGSIADLAKPIAMFDRSDGAPVEIVGPPAVEGTARGIAVDGSLRVAVGPEIRSISAGEVVFRFDLA